MNPTTFRAPVAFTVTDASALVLLADFNRAARAAGWTKTQIEENVEHVIMGDYRYLQCTLAAYTEDFLADSCG